MDDYDQYMESMYEQYMQEQADHEYQQYAEECLRRHAEEEDVFPDEEMRLPVCRQCLYCSCGRKIAGCEFSSLQEDKCAYIDDAGPFYCSECIVSVVQEELALEASVQWVV